MSNVTGKGDILRFFINGKKVTENHADPETMLLSFLREKLRLTGTKYGCGGGGCGACTVMVSRYQPATKTIIHYSANACLLPLCQLHGAAVTTVEGIGSTKTRIHPVQERIAKAHGSQCGFCTPGMVMSMYALLRNNPRPTMEDITQALAGNLCRCTGYRPIVDGCRTFCQEANCCQDNGAGKCCLNGEENTDEPGHEKPQLFDKEEFLPLDPTQELIFPPELILMAETAKPQTLTFHGERMSWVSPASLDELVQLKTSNPKAPLVMGNTNIGPDIKFKGVLHPLIISPTRVKELFEVTQTQQGVWVGAGCSLSEVRSLLEKLVPQFPEEKTELFRALIQQLGNLGSQQIRNVASLGGSVMSAYPNSDLNPVLAAGNCKVSVILNGGRREVPLNQDFFVSFGKTILKPEEIVVSVFIPFSRKGEFIRAFRQAPRKESSFATVTTGMRVFFSEGSRMVQDVDVYYGGLGPTTVSAAKTCAAIVTRPWDNETLSRAYDILLDELVLPPSAPGGKVEFRRSLTLSFLFKFNLEILLKLREMNVITDEFPEKMQIQPLPREIQPSVQEFQDVSKRQSDQDPVGRPIMHRSAISHATGEAVYCDDIPRTNGELFLALVTSSRAHAKITGLDMSEALQLPGVVDVITAKDIPGKKVRKMFGYPEELLAESEVSCVGQIICAVVADTRAHAKRGAAGVKISYEDLPDPVFTTEEAIEKSSFFEPRRVIERGNVADAFKTVDHLYEGGIRMGGQEHFYMETQSMLVVPVGEEMEFNVYVSTQWPTSTQDAIAETLDIPSNRVTCHVKRMGGAFGGKVTKTSILASITSVAAWKTNHAVRCVLERGEDMLITGGRHPVLGKYKVGFMNDGRIVAADIQYYINAGNTVDESLLVVEKILLHIDNAYNIPNLKGRAAACRTNLPSNTAFRGFGVPQSIMIVENMVNDVAVVLGRPADQIREINMYKGPSVTHYKFEFSPENMLRCWEECKVKSDYSARCRAIDQFNQQNRWKKRGMSIIPIKYGIAFAESFLNQAAALVHIYKDGSVLVTHGGTEMGQGIHTKMQQVASCELHIPPSKIYISETSTNTVPNTCPSAASFGTDANGMAVQNACQTLYQRLEPIRQKNPKGSWESWVTAAFFEKISLSATGFYRGPDLYMDWDKMEGQPYAYFTFGACCSEVELDCLTGDYRTVRTDIVVDIGRSVNPSVDIGQIEGAFIQGLGLFTLEELKFSPSGLLYTRGPSQYKIPAVCDLPLHFNVYLLSDSHNPHAIYSSKGIGEPILFLGSSVFFAIKHAAAAARLECGLIGPFSLDSPATPEKACLACASPFTQKIPASKPGSFKPWALNI
ncbi:aldehyde oxidase 6 isoform X2 [Micropterus dolomieu]|uniref:aldehyde oxidase 6 isoform X1 n=1 Tax=Micropterus dolomieu TaxID=147949 RepID=UPI001E8E5C4E|nr:aldehyde oxidase 6 isoform X1 [Micropterus dolomieu]XP_045916390.1 aldehyde oxidase 6 isoform X2 [Micropterus dolomieu]